MLVFLWTVQALHVLGWLFASFTPLVTDSALLNAFVVAVNTATLVGWVLAGGRCVLSDLEKYLGAEQQYFEDGVPMTIVSELVTNVTGSREATKVLTTTLPLFACGLALYKLTRSALRCEALG